MILTLTTAACGGSQTSDTQPEAAKTSAIDSTRSTTSGGDTSRPENTLANEEAGKALISAAGRGDERAVRELLDQGADVEASSENGVTPLIAAAYDNHLGVARLLIEAGANVNAKDSTQQSAYLISTSEIGDDPRLLELTLRNGADVDSLDSYNGTGLIRAADRGYVEIIRVLLNTEIDIDHVNNLGWTALLEAIILGDCGRQHTEVVRLLVEAGANVNLADGNGVTPLEHARGSGCNEIAQLLESAGAR